MSYIPLAFLIGFYVQQVCFRLVDTSFLIYLLQVVTRWWSTFTVLPYPDKIALKLVSFCPGKVLVDIWRNVIDDCFSGSFHQEPAENYNEICQFVYNSRVQTSVQKGIICYILVHRCLSLLFVSHSTFLQWTRREHRHIDSWYLSTNNSKYAARKYDVALENSWDISGVKIQSS